MNSRIDNPNSSHQPLLYHPNDNINLHILIWKISSMFSSFPFPACRTQAEGDYLFLDRWCPASPTHLTVLMIMTDYVNPFYVPDFTLSVLERFDCPSIAGHLNILSTLFAFHRCVHFHFHFLPATLPDGGRGVGLEGFFLSLLFLFLSRIWKKLHFVCCEFKRRSRWAILLAP